MEFNDIYDRNRNLTGRIHKRGTPWKPGEYGLVVCVWVHDGNGKFLLTRRARGKSYAGTWENSGGAAKAGESSLRAIVRELYEETGIRAEAKAFQLIGSDRDRNTFYDHYCLESPTPLEKITLLPGETDGAKWVTFDQIHEMIASRQICSIIAGQFLRLEPELRKRQTAQA